MLWPRFVACAQVLLQVLLLVLVVENLHDGNGVQNQPRLGFLWVLSHPTGLCVNLRVRTVFRACPSCC